MDKLELSLIYQQWVIWHKTKLSQTKLFILNIKIYSVYVNIDMLIGLEIKLNTEQTQQE